MSVCLSVHLCVCGQVAGCAAGVCRKLHRPVRCPIRRDLQAQSQRRLGGPVCVILTAGKRWGSQLDFLILFMGESVVRFLDLYFESGQELGERMGAEWRLRSPVTHWRWGGDEARGQDSPISQGNPLKTQQDASSCRKNADLSMTFPPVTALAWSPKFEYMVFPFTI